MNVGDKVLVPRTGGGETEGEVIEVYTEHARVRFLVGDTFHGHKVVGMNQLYGYKTLRQDALRIVEEVNN